MGIIIPVKSNINLTKCDRGLCAKDAEAYDEDTEEPSDKALWDEMKEIAEKRVKSYFEGIGYDGFPGFEDCGCVRDLVGAYKK